MGRAHGTNGREEKFVKASGREAGKKRSKFENTGIEGRMI